MQLKSFLSSCFLLQIILVLLRQKTCSGSKNHQKTLCPPSHCGNIRNISYPFRLKGDPASCGDPENELTCENNRTLLLSLFPGENYQLIVKAINYNNFTLRLVDPGIQEGDCSSFPRYFLSSRNFFRSYDHNSYTAGSYEINEDKLYEYNRGFELSPGSSMFQHVIFMNCSNPVYDGFYVDTSACINNSHFHGHIYAIAGDMLVQNLIPQCHVKLVTPISLLNGSEFLTFTYREIHRMLVNGFEVSWLNRRRCHHLCGGTDCSFNGFTRSVKCEYFRYCTSPLGFSISCHIDTDTMPYRLGILSKGRIFLEDIILGIARELVVLLKGVSIDDNSYGFSNNQLGFAIGRGTGYVLASYIVMRFIFGLILFSGKLIHIYQTRHTSVYENIENFLQGNTLMPIRYSYKDIKKMTRGFKDKLGEGGYGSVYKGKLRSGLLVAVKMLGKPKANGQEFINEVATIGRIHHGNVVQLIGFCVEASKRALVYEFLPNSSLDRYISSQENDSSLTYNQMYTISLGVAQGIAYLHQGCDMQILHFDIKPHNILLDENFIPKVSDFGLAKLYSNDNNIVTLTAVRGTIGYMAPELFYQNIGGVSYKADVYSYGMLLMEMANRRRNLNPYADNSSQIFLPLWIYDQLIEEREIEMEEVTDEEKNNVKKMFIIALWCIQLKPNDRPSMNKVIEMLEGDVESIIMPPKPSLYPIESVQDLGNNFDESISGDTSSSIFQEGPLILKDFLDIS